MGHPTEIKQSMIILLSNIMCGHAPAKLKMILMIGNKAEQTLTLIFVVVYVAWLCLANYETIFEQR